MGLGNGERQEVYGETNICRLCPRGCGVRRAETTGFCGATDELEVSSVCVHRGEEPPLNPIVNVFFSHCNLQCIYCQNWQISGPKTVGGECRTESVESLADRICQLLPSPDRRESCGETPLLGLVTAAHYADRIPKLIEALRQRGISPTVVYNSGGYESVETLSNLEGLVDVYLPDFKYMDSGIAARYSHAADYPEVATAALEEMKRQVGGGLKVDDSGRAYRGIIVRHLVLPGHTDNSLAVLERLADLFTPFTLRLSLMAQYYPPRQGLPEPLDRTLTAEEYGVVVDRAAELGFTNGWVQELNAQDNYRPDFNNTDNPFA